MSSKKYIFKRLLENNDLSNNSNEYNNEIINHLNKAFCDEWLAIYQYWLGSKLIQNDEKTSEVISEFKQHSKEELEHANLLLYRIVELGGKPILEPKQWYNYTNCGFLSPENSDIQILLQQNLKGEKCAVNNYIKLLNFCKDKDEITYKLIEKILNKEIEHVNDLNKLLNK